MIDAEVKKHLDTGEGAVYAFSAACEGMSGTKFVLAERKIRELLLMVAGSGLLHKIVASSTEGYDFAKGMKLARIKTGQVTSLAPPTLASEQIAFAMNILYAIDSGGVKLTDFLTQYYGGSGGVTYAFSSFVRGIIVPLGRNAEIALEQLKQNKDALSSNYAHSVSRRAVQDAASELKNFINLEPSITDLERQELMTYMSAVLSYIDKGDYSLARRYLGTLSNVAATLPVSPSFGESTNVLNSSLTNLIESI